MFEKPRVWPSLDIVFDSSLRDHIDGVKNIKQISEDSNVDINAVKMVIMHLAYFNVCKVTDIFSYEN